MARPPLLLTLLAVRPCAPADEPPPGLCRDVWGSAASEAANASAFELVWEGAACHTPACVTEGGGRTSPFGLACEGMRMPLAEAMIRAAPAPAKARMLRGVGGWHGALHQWQSLAVQLARELLLRRSDGGVPPPPDGWVSAGLPPMREWADRSPTLRRLLAPGGTSGTCEDAAGPVPANTVLHAECAEAVNEWVAPLLELVAGTPAGALPDHPALYQLGLWGSSLPHFLAATNSTLTATPPGSGAEDRSGAKPAEVATAAGWVAAAASQPLRFPAAASLTGSKRDRIRQRDQRGGWSPKPPGGQADEGQEACDIDELSPNELDDGEHASSHRDR